MKVQYYLLILFLIWIIVAQTCCMFRISDKKATANFAKEGVLLHTQTLPVFNRHLHFVSTGADSLPAIVFIHGSPGSWEAFEHYLRDPELLQHYKMIAVDRPGFGYSDFGNSLNLEEQSQIVSALLAQLKKDKPVYLVGHSLGGPLIARLAIDNPGRIASLVLLAGSIDPAAENKEYWRKIFMHNPLQYLIPGAMRPSNDELWYLKKDLKILSPLLKNVTCPVYFIHGNKDMLVPYSNMAFGVKSFSNAALIDTTTIPGANHFIPWSHYDVVKKVLLRLK